MVTLLIWGPSSQIHNPKCSKMILFLKRSPRFYPYFSENVIILKNILKRCLQHLRLYDCLSVMRGLKSKVQHQKTIRVTVNKAQNLYISGCCYSKHCLPGNKQKRKLYLHNRPVKRYYCILSILTPLGSFCSTLFSLMYLWCTSGLYSTPSFIGSNPEASDTTNGRSKH